MTRDTVDGMQHIARAPRFGAPPLPHEHGAWVMLYAPAIVAWLAAGSVPALPATLFVMAVTAVFLGRNAAGLMMRRRGGANAVLWTAVFAVVLLAASAPLLLSPCGWSLLGIGAAAAALFGVHSLLIVRSTRRRLDRSLWGEVLAVAALSLAGPAAWVVAGGQLDGQAALLWLGPTLFFSSGVFSVKSRLNAVKVRGSFTAADRRHAARDSVVYHALLAAAVLGGAAAAGGAWGWPALLAFLPALIRGFWTSATLTNRLPNLKLVGAMETVIALWFTGVFAWALQPR